MPSFANKKESKQKAINRYISLSDWKGISLQFNKKKVWFSFQKPGSNSNKSLCRDKSISQQISILIKNMNYAPDKLDYNKIKESMSERQWNYLKPGVINNFVNNYNDEIERNNMMPSEAPMDKQIPSNYSTNDQYSESEYDDDDINYTRPPSEYAHSHAPSSHFDNYSIKNEQHYNNGSVDMQSHEQEPDGLPSYPMEQHNYGLPSEVATFDNHHDNQFNLSSPVPFQDPSNIVTMKMDQDNDNDIDLLPTAEPTTLPTEHGHESYPYPDTDPNHNHNPVPAVHPQSYPPPKASGYGYEYTMPPSTSHYYDPLKMAMDASYPTKYPMYPMHAMQSYPTSGYPSTYPPTSVYADYWNQMYNNHMMMSPPSPKNPYVSKEDEKDYEEWLQEKNKAYDSYKIQMNKMKKYFEKRMEKAIENEGFWKKKYEDLLAKYTMQQSEIESMNGSNNSHNNKSPATSSSSQFSAAAVAMNDLNISDKPGKLRRNKRKLNESEHNDNDEFMAIKQQSPPKRFKMDTSCCYSSDNVSSTDHVMLNNSIHNDPLQHFENGFETNSQFAF